MNGIIACAIFLLTIITFSCTDTGASVNEEFQQESANTVTNDDISIENGRLVYNRFCKMCHGETGNLGFSNAADLTVSKLSETEIEIVVLDGKNTMVGFKDNLSENQVKAVSKFCFDLSNNKL